ncbi:MAG: tyrosine-type recombinase/integrase [Hyphomicrobium sp.]
MAKKIRISKSSIDALPTAEQRYVVWDDRLPAFGIEVMTTGVKSYKLMFRHHGRLRKMTLGRHGAITAEEARDLAKKALGRVANGSDPAQEKLEARRAETLSVAFEDWLKKHIDTKRKATTRSEYHRLYNKHVKPALGTRPVRDINRADVSQLHRKLSDSPYVANRVVALLRSFFSWCERQSIRPLHSNPASRIDIFREVKRERVLSPDEFAELGRALRSSAEEWPYAIAAILLLLFTGARRGEILGLRWAHIDLVAGTARLPDSKTGAKTLYLSEAARAVLADLPRQPDNPFVICGIIKGQPLIGLPRIWRRIRKRAGLEDVRMHDLRHAFASAAAMGGMPLLTIGRLLGHSQPSVTDRYAHFASSPLVSAADSVANEIKLQLEGPRPKNQSSPRRRK